MTDEKIDYAVFDAFLNIETWHTLHPLDEKRFYKSLSAVVRHPNFAPEEMGTYFRDFHEIGDDHQHSDAVDGYVLRAWAIMGYLNAMEEVS